MTPCVWTVPSVIVITMFWATPAAAGDKNHAAEGINPHEILRTGWGDPDLQGTYVRPRGIPSPLCYPGAADVPSMPAAYLGVTRIRQAPGLVTIRNQFSNRSRTVVLSPHPAAREANSSGHWEGATLVIESQEGSPSLVPRPAGHEKASDTRHRTTERFTREDAGTIRYDVTIHAVGGGVPWTMSFTLWRPIARWQQFDDVTAGCTP